MTERHQATLLGRMAVGANWLIAWRLTTRILGLVNILVVIRLLAPEDFGLITLAFSFILTIETLTALGTDAQIIRSAEPTRALYDTAFTFNAIRACLIAAIVLASSSIVADWFGDGRLRVLLATVAFHTILKGLANVRAVAFQRDLEFGKVFALQIVPRLAQVAISIVFAIMLRNYWALVAGMLAWSISSLILGYALVPYRPKLTLTAWRELFSVSVWSWMINVAAVVRDRVDMLVIGRSFGTIQAGLYSIAYELASLPISEVVGPISHAAMPGFAAGLRLNGLGQTATAFTRVAGLSILLAMPMGVGLSLVAGPLVTLAVGLRWQDASPLMAVIGIAAIPMAPGLIASALLTARARLALLFGITTAGAFLRVVTVIGITRHHGLMAIAVGMGVAVAIENALLVISALRTLGLSPLCMIKLLWRPSLGAIAMAAALRVAGLAWIAPPQETLAAAKALLFGCGIGAVSFTATVGVLWLAVGRPEGPESDLLLLARRNLGSIAAFVRRR